MEEIAHRNERILVSGGAGFIGAHLSMHLAGLGFEVIALDSLERKGSETNVPRLLERGIDWIQGDVRDAGMYSKIGEVSMVLDCCALPSVLEGVQGSVRPVIETNLNGTLLQLEHAANCQARFMLLSTSRVLPIPQLTKLPIAMDDLRVKLDINATLDHDGCSPEGISEDFPLWPGHRSFYGASKLAAEMLVQEFAAFKGLQTLINRCGVVAGPGQFGRIDQGVLAFWVESHASKRPLSYLGFDGSGRQVRDFLHVADLAQLIENQILTPSWDGSTYHVGGGPSCSLSLAELTDLCVQVTGQETPIAPAPQEPRPGDIPWLIMDSRKVQEAFDWRTRRTPLDLVRDTYEYIEHHG